MSHTGESPLEANLTLSSAANIFNNHHITITQDPYPTLPYNDSPNLFDQLNSYLLTTENDGNTTSMITIMDESISTTTDNLLCQFAFEHNQQIQFDCDLMKKEHII